MEMRLRTGLATAVLAGLLTAGTAYAQTQGPGGEAPTPTSEIALTDEEVMKLKEGGHTAALLLGGRRFAHGPPPQPVEKIVAQGAREEDRLGSGIGHAAADRRPGKAGDRPAPEPHLAVILVEATRQDAGQHTRTRGAVCDDRDMGRQLDSEVRRLDDR